MKTELRWLLACLAIAVLFQPAYADDDTTAWANPEQRERLRERFRDMSPEQRQRIREHLRERAGERQRTTRDQR